MRTLRRSFLLLIVTLLVFAAVPTSAELIKFDHTGFSATWDEELAHHSLRAGTLNGQTAAILLDMVYRDDEEFHGWRLERRYLTDVVLTVSPDLASAMLTGQLDGTPISAVLTATAKAQNTPPRHPAPWESVDCDGLAVYIETGHYRAGAGSVTIGEATQPVTGQIFEEKIKEQADQSKPNGQCSNVLPHGSKNPPDQH